MRFLKMTVFACCLAAIVSCNRSIQQDTTRGANSADKNQLTVLSYNIHHANPPSKPGFIDLPAIAKVIKESGADVVALQEVDVYTQRSGKNSHQAEDLARLTGMKAHFAKGIDYEGGEYGVAFLSRLPMEDFKNTPLPTDESTKGEHRTLGTVVITLPSKKKVMFAFTHLDAQRNSTNRVLQINKIVDILTPQTLPVIIAGDLNAAPGSDVINILDKNFTRTCVTGCGFTIPVEKPNKTIDFIAFKPQNAFNVISHKVIDERYASDHLPVKAVLEVK